jgi:hypothetical protein
LLIFKARDRRKGAPRAQFDWRGAAHPAVMRITATVQEWVPLNGRAQYLVWRAMSFAVPRARAW